MSRSEVDIFRAIFALLACVGVVTWATSPAGSVLSAIELLGAIGALVALLLAPALVGSPMQTTQTSESEGLPTNLTLIHDQIEWWQGRLAYLRRTYDQRIPDPSTVLDQVSSYPPEAFAPDDDPDTVTVVVLRGPAAHTELRVYFDLLTRTFRELNSDTHIDVHSVKFRVGSAPTESGFTWELQRINVRANKGRSSDYVIAATHGPLPGAGVLAVALLRDQLGVDEIYADMPGYAVQDLRETLHDVPYLSCCGGSDAVPYVATSSGSLAVPCHAIPVFV